MNVFGYMPIIIIIIIIIIKEEMKIKIYNSVRKF